MPVASVPSFHSSYYMLKDNWCTKNKGTKQPWKRNSSCKCVVSVNDIPTTPSLTLTCRDGVVGMTIGSLSIGGAWAGINYLTSTIYSSCHGVLSYALNPDIECGCHRLAPLGCIIRRELHDTNCPVVHYLGNIIWPGRCHVVSDILSRYLIRRTQLPDDIKVQIKGEVVRELCPKDEGVEDR